jgi:putative membrane-bound dehydrogenase-like protein
MNPSRSLTPLLLVASALAVSSPATAAIEDLQPKAGLPPLPYQETPHPMPNYLAGQRWGTEGEKITRMQTPLTPDKSAERIVLRQGFQAALWAADPLILKPISMAFDARGRLWIAETVDYPNELQKPGEGRDRIKICEDTDGDGKADKFTVFADKLSIPTGLCHANGGLIVIEGGQTLFLRDTDGDDKADERKVLFKGWGMGDTHATASNIRHGHDNWIWGVVGYSGFEGEVGGKRVKFGMGVFRFKADGSALEFIRSSNNNTWGLGLSEDGLVFGSTANGNAAWYMPIANRHYEAVSGWSAARMESIADNQLYHPIAKNVRQVDWHGKYTAGAGSALYTARSFPKDYWNRVSFVTEPTGHLIGQFRFEGSGADFKAANEKNFLASDDEWFSPIMAEVGPDGALWVLDWYNFIIQHNPTPNGFRNGKGNAYETPLRDKTHGRIYRVTHRDGTPAPKVDLSARDPERRLTALGSPVMEVRLQAQRLLVEAQDRAVVPDLVRMASDASVDDLGLNPRALHALWTLHGLGASGSAPAGALAHASAAVRRAAIQTLPASAWSAADWKRLLVSDTDAQVRLAALLAVAERGDTASILPLVEAFRDARNTTDPWLKDALTAAAAQHHQAFLTSAVSVSPESAGALDVLRTVARHHAATEANALKLALAAAGARPAVSGAILEGLTAGWPAQRIPQITPEMAGRIRAAAAKAPDAGKVALVQLATLWGRADLVADQIPGLSGKLVQSLGRADAPDAERIDAARRLMAIADSKDSVAAILGQIGTLTPPPLANGLIGTLGTSRIPETASVILARWPEFSPASRRTATALMLRRKGWADALLGAVEAGSLPAGDIGRDHWSQLAGHSDQGVAAKARSLQKAGPPKSSAAMQAMIDRLQPLVLKAGKADHGREVFEKNCSACHAMAGKGGRIGPELTGIGSRPKAEILTEILDPNRSVEANYRLWTATRKDGESVSGRLDAETATSVEIVDTTGAKHVVQRSEIAKLESSGQSLMPGGFEQLPPQDLGDLLEYLATTGAKH